MSIIVTATTGQLGALVVDSLLARGAAPADVVATARDASRLAAFAGRGARTAHLDYAEPETVTAAIDAGDVLVLISGDELEEHENVITAAKDAGAARIIYTSTFRADKSWFVKAPKHMATEDFLAASGVPSIILRNGWYTENFAPEAAKARETGEIVASVGGGRVASASRSDFAEAAAVAALDDSLAGQTFELSGDHAWDYDELARALSGIVGRTVSYRDVTTEEYADLLRAAGIDDTTVAMLASVDVNIRNGGLAGTPGDLSRLIGHPTVPLAEGLAATVQRFRG